MEIDIPKVLSALSKRRPIFHSEADFQHELAWQIRSSNCDAEICDAEIRLEQPHIDSAGATDLVIRTAGKVHGVELKYLTKKAEHSHLGETFYLKQQGAHPLRRYDVCKDIKRMEDFGEKHAGSTHVIVLTNDAAYFSRRTKRIVCDEEYRIDGIRPLKGKLSWDEVLASEGTRKGRESSIDLKGEYQLLWHSYGDSTQGTPTFKYLHVRVK